MSGSSPVDGYRLYILAARARVEGDRRRHRVGCSENLLTQLRRIDPLALTRLRQLHCDLHRRHRVQREVNGNLVARLHRDAHRLIGVRRIGVVSGLVSHIQWRARPFFAGSAAAVVRGKDRRSMGRVPGPADHRHKVVSRRQPRKLVMALVVRIRCSCIDLSFYAHPVIEAVKMDHGMRHRISRVLAHGTGYHPLRRKREADPGCIQSCARDYCRKVPFMLFQAGRDVASMRSPEGKSSIGKLAERKFTRLQADGRALRFS